MKWFMFTRRDKQGSSLLQSAPVWTYHGSPLPWPQEFYLLYTKETLLFGSIHTPVDLLLHHLTGAWELAKKNRDDVEIHFIPVPRMKLPRPTSKREVSPQKRRRKKGGTWRMGRFSSPGKNLPLQWWWTAEAKVSGRYYVNYQDSKAMLWWWERLEAMCSPQTPMNLVIFSPPTTLGWILSDLGPWGKKNIKKEYVPSQLSCASSLSQGSREQGCGMPFHRSSPTRDAEQTSSNCLLFRSVKRLTLSSSLIVPPFQGHHLKQRSAQQRDEALHP